MSGRPNDCKGRVVPVADHGVHGTHGSPRGNPRSHVGEGRCVRVRIEVASTGRAQGCDAVQVLPIVDPEEGIVIDCVGRESREVAQPWGRREVGANRLHTVGALGIGLADGSPDDVGEGDTAAADSDAPGG